MTVFAEKEPRQAQPRVFISYAKEDENAARGLHQELETLGARPWLDVVDLLPGQEWKHEISDAIGTSDFCLVMLSSYSVRKKGYVQKEIRQALELLDEFPPGQIYIIPVRLEECEPQHPKLRDLQWVDLFPSRDEGLAKIATTLGLRAAQSLSVEKPAAPPRIDAIDWTGVDIRKTSGDGSIHSHLRAMLESENEVVFYDYGIKEIADFVALNHIVPIVRCSLFQCNFSSSSQPGARVSDIWMMLDKVTKSLKWLDAPRQLFDRMRYRTANGRSRFLVGDLTTAEKFLTQSSGNAWELEIVFVQPGLSAHRITPRIRSQIEVVDAYAAAAGARFRALVSP